jgi:choline dehydrogenase-like flavoprotein
VSRNVLGNTSITRFDALVIGSGAGGGTITAMLTAHGRKVLVLEAGACHFDHLDDPARDPVSRFSNDELKLAYRNWVYPDLTAEPRTWRTSEADGVRLKLADVNGLPKTVGGGAVHADLKMPRFIPQDFHLGTALGAVTGASFADWPIDYDALEPYYLWAERISGVQGAVVGYPDEPPRSAPFPMPPGLAMYCATKVVTGTESIGLHPFPYPAAVNSRPYGGRPACVDCGFCSGFGCPNNAKGSPPVTTLRQALLSGNCLLLAETRVVKLLPNSAGTAIAGVEAIGPDGRRVTYHADAYVLAASPIEDARLLFLSDPAGLGNSSGQVGRNLMFHLQTNAIGIWEERLHGFRGRTVTHGFSDFRGAPNDPLRPLGGIVEISGSEGVLQEAMFIKQIYDTLGGYDGTRFKAMMRQSPTRDRVVALAMQAEDAPQPTNRVDLDPDIRDLDRLPVARVTYANHPFELSASDFYGPKLLQLLGASGARWAVPAPRDEIPASAHIMGTLRFGTDPAASVCDANGRFHDLGNLYAADGSLFPTSSGFNPTLTIMALAARVGAAMIYPSNPDLALG